MFLALALLLAPSLAVSPGADVRSLLHERRSLPGDLELGGSLAGQPRGSTRYISYRDLLQLPQETYTVNDDTNFRGATQISGVPLAVLAAALGERADMVVAICYDHYRTNYPSDYLAAHHPLLVLRINGQERGHWPAAESGGSMGPYLISHPTFKPSFQVLSHDDEPQVPYGVTRIEFRQQAKVFGAIQPRGMWSADSQVGQGFIIARQDCFRCHNMGVEGGIMAHSSWLKLARIADQNGARFGRIIHDPQSVTPGAKMPAQGSYDAATLQALTAYFRSFVRTPRTDRSRGKPVRESKP